MYKNILLEKDGGIATITINRPKELNALNLATMLELDDAIKKLADDQSLGVLIITGSGEKALARRRL